VILFLRALVADASNLKPPVLESLDQPGGSAG